MSYEYPIPGISDEGRMFGVKSVQARGPLAVLDDTGTEIGENLNGLATYFPDDLRNIDHWVTFRAFKFEGAIRSRELREEDAKKIPKAYITLPLAKGLSTDYSVSYEDEGAGGLTSAIADIVQKIGENRVTFGAAAQAASQAATGLASDLLRGSNIGRLVGGQLGVARNPHNVVLFSHVPFRTHTFSYTFIPVSRSESEKLRTIISLFKYFMSPSLGSEELSKKFDNSNNNDIKVEIERTQADLARARNNIDNFDPEKPISQQLDLVTKPVKSGRLLATGFNVGTINSITSRDLTSENALRGLQKEADELEKRLANLVNKKNKTSIAEDFLIGAGRNVFVYPEYFEIDFHHPQFLFNIGPSMLESFSVDYHPNNIPAYVRTRIENDDNSPAPQAVKLDFKFKEVEIVTKETIQKNNR
jgi:hypothetical protein